MLEKKIIAVNEASLRRAKFKWKGLLAEKYNFFSFFPADGQRGHNSHSGQPMLPAEYCAEDPAAASAVAFYSAMEALDEALFANIPCELGFEKIKNYAIHLQLNSSSRLVFYAPCNVICGNVSNELFFLL